MKRYNILNDELGTITNKIDIMKHLIPMDNIYEIYVDIVYSDKYSIKCGNEYNVHDKINKIMTNFIKCHNNKPFSKSIFYGFTDYINVYYGYWKINYITIDINLCDLNRIKMHLESDGYIQVIKYKEN